MRLFFAIEIPEKIQQKILGVQQELKKSGADIKWVKPANIHLTLKFLGEVEDEKLPELVRVGEKISKDFSPFAVEICGVGVFPNINRPRVIWAGIENGSKEMENLSELLSRQLAKIGFPEEKRRFVGHLTIGRVKSPQRKGHLIESFKSLEKADFGRFPVSSLSLIKSQLTPAGPIYTVLKKFSF